MKLIADVLYEYLQEVQSLIGPPIAAIFFLGIFSKRVTPTGGYVGMVSGFVLGMLRLVAVIFSDMFAQGSLLYRFVEINWLHYSEFLFVFSIVMILVVSLFTKKPTKEQLSGMTFYSITDEQKAETRASWNKWDVIHTVIILGIVVAFYAIFW